MHKKKKPTGIETKMRRLNSICLSAKATRHTHFLQNTNWLPGSLWFESEDFFKAENDNCWCLECHLGVIFFSQQQKNIEPLHSRARIQSEGCLQGRERYPRKNPRVPNTVHALFQNTDPHNFLNNSGHEKTCKMSWARWEHKWENGIFKKRWLWVLNH